MAYLAASLDGFIARENGDLDWLPQPTETADDFGFSAFLSSVDTLVMGRGTFEKVLTFGQWPFDGKRVVVLSTRLAKRDLPATVAPRVELHPGPIVALVKWLAQAGARRVYVDGGKVIQGFLAAGLLAEITLTRVPVILGAGIPLFGPLARDIRLVHVKTVSLDLGLVQSTYRISKPVTI